MDKALFGRLLKQGPLILDGATGSNLQAAGMKTGVCPEQWILENPEALIKLQQEYVSAGTNILYAPTFTANRIKLAEYGYADRLHEMNQRLVALSKEAAAGAQGVYIAGDISMTGQQLYPIGEMQFEELVEIYKEQVRSLEEAGVDLYVVETMMSLQECRAAVLAVKETNNLPVLVSLTYEDTGRTLFGTDPATAAIVLQSLGVDVIGMNCSAGPDKMAEQVRAMYDVSCIPVLVKPNAGLPKLAGGKTVYDMQPQEFAEAMKTLAANGARVFGGCCGTSPDYIRRLRAALDGKAPAPRRCRRESFLCTPPCPVPLDGVRIIGERVNPTGKKRFQQALLEDDLDYILDVAVQQEEAGADILDVNVGFPGVDEASMLPRVVKKLQSVVSLPLQLDSSSPEALEAGLRVYNGKAAVNSVNGDPESLARILPIVKKYGAAVVGLTLDQNGIPQTAEGRVAIARRILDAALARGIPAEDVWIDCLTLTVSAQQEQAAETLKAVRAVTEDLGLRTVLGVSNISFGLPSRGLITRSFLTQALAAGLTLPILNPNQREMLDAVAAFRALSGEDAQCRAYVERFAGADAAPAPVQPGRDMTLEDAILRGLKGDAGRLARQALEAEDGLSLVEGRLIPALDRVGEGYETGRLFLPQLLSAAQAAQAVFEAVRVHLADKGDAPVKRGRIAVATVRGDIHDIGKNIVKTVLENYGYDVADLGRDVPPEDIVEAVAAKQIPLVGLSALMTTTLPAMEETTRLLKALPNPPVVWVGGAVVTPEYARSIGADYYARDAKQSVEIAKKVLG